MALAHRNLPQKSEDGKPLMPDVTSVLAALHDGSLGRRRTGPEAPRGDSGSGGCAAPRARRWFVSAVLVRAFTPSGLKSQTPTSPATADPWCGTPSGCFDSTLKSSGRTSSGIGGSGFLRRGEYTCPVQEHPESAGIRSTAPSQGDAAGPPGAELQFRFLVTALPAQPLGHPPYR